MFEVLIFGTGVNMQRMINYINYDCVNIAAYIDNDVNKIGKKIKDKEIISPMNINEYVYDYIIITSLGSYKEITEQLLNLKVDKEKIVQLYNGSYILDEVILFNDEQVINEDIKKLFTSVPCARFNAWKEGIQCEVSELRREVEEY